MLTMAQMSLKIPPCSLLIPLVFSIHPVPATLLLRVIFFLCDKDAVTSPVTNFDPKQLFLLWSIEPLSVADVPASLFSPSAIPTQLPTL